MSRGALRIKSPPGRTDNRKDMRRYKHNSLRVLVMKAGAGFLGMLFLGAGLTPLRADDLQLTPSDIAVTADEDGGYHLYIRKNDGMGSVLLTESTADPAKQAASYTLRAGEYNPVNGDERRILDGEFLEPEEPLYFLLDSSPEEVEGFGRAFHVYIPETVEYGYPWSRSGQIEVRNGTWMGIRTFALPYADYRGEFRDNPFILRLREREREVAAAIELPEEDKVYNPEVAESMEEMAEKSGGLLYYSSGKDDVVDEMGRILDSVDEDNLDIVIVLDTTASMKDDIAFLQSDLVDLIQEKISRFKSFRIGVVLYRDYKEAYVARSFPFQEDFGFFQDTLDGIDVSGGRDVPEAVYEAIYAGVTEMEWESDARLIVQVGDAPPHPKPMGWITEDLVLEEASKKGISINSIIIPLK